jgi:hypothetical protein
LAGVASEAPGLQTLKTRSSFVCEHEKEKGIISLRLNSHPNFVTLLGFDDECRTLVFERLNWSWRRMKLAM